VKIFDSTKELIITLALVCVPVFAALRFYRAAKRHQATRKDAEGEK
jgi:hypothetical protein